MRTKDIVIRLSLLLTLSAFLSACGGDDDNKGRSGMNDDMSGDMNDDMSGGSGDMGDDMDDDMDGDMSDDMGGDSDVEMAAFTVTITNMTNGQILSPPAVILHGDSYSAWEIGSPASEGLEYLAESGSPAELIEEAGIDTSVAGDGPVIPGNAVTLDIEAPHDSALQLTVATMLVYTNDAYTGATGWELGGMDVGDEQSLLAPVYDAGTEANSESAASIPGPDIGGEPFNAERDDSNRVARHPGVVTSDDGFVESALTQSHRFDNGAMLVTVRRVE